MHAPLSRGPMGPPPFSDSHAGGPPPVKTKLCTRFTSPEGCKFGDKCNFAHGERELGKPLVPFQDMPANDYGSRMGPPPASSFGARPGFQPNPSEFGPRMGGPPAPSSFGASATAKISVDSSLSGAIIGKGGVNTKHICRVTGAKVAIRDHESDANLKNIELEGTFDQINQASAMVQELIMTIRSGPPAQMPPVKNAGFGGHAPGAGGPRPDFRTKLKTKLCDNFSKGTCTFGEQCSFAHGESELRKSNV